MNNLIKYLLYLLVALLLISWLITVGKSCGKPDVQAENTAPTPYEIQQEQTALENEEDSIDFSEELESILDEEEELQSIVEDEDDLDYSSYDPKKDEKVAEKPAPKKEEVVAKPKPKPKATSKPAPKATSSGRYMVIVGSYIHPDNADNQKRKMEKLGYSGEVVVFDLSEYYTVLAGRYSDFSSAQRIVNQLSGKGVDAYVKKQTF